MSAATLRVVDGTSDSKPQVSGRKPHVCFVAPYAWPVLSGDPSLKVVGGAEVQQCILARQLAARGYRVSMVSFDFGQPHRAVLDGIEVYKAFAEKDGIPVLRFLHPRLTRMWRVLREVDADIYYQRSAAIWTEVVAQFCRRHGKRSIYAGASDRDFEAGHEQIRFARDRWLFRRGLAHVDRVVVQNPHQLAACRANHGRDAILIPSCYQPPAQARRATPACSLVLWVGSLHHHKRPDWLLDIAERLPHRRFMLIGGPSIGGEVVRPGFYESMRRRAAGLANVEFTGFLPLAEVERRFDQARVLVSTSFAEGMPNIFLQAWARGVPTVATIDVGAPVNTVFKDVDEGAERLERLLTDEALWSRASEDSLEYFRRNHSPEEVLARYARLFAELAA